MPKRRKIVKLVESKIIKGHLNLPSGVLDCGHHAFLRNAKDKIEIGQVRMCGLCDAPAAPVKA